MLKRIRNIGPGALIAAAFIGPGTVTACTLAGANYGYSLLWALLFATFATIILQEMSARLGLVTQQGLGETLAIIFRQSKWKWPLFGLIIVALYLGNAAYEAGNLSGAALGLGSLSNNAPYTYQISVSVISLLAAVLFLFGSYKQIEKILLTLVTLMAFAFLATFFAVKADMSLLFKGMFTPSLPEGSLLTVIALIGTTIVPYNLFLHASAVKAKWTSIEDLQYARTDTSIAIGLGGLITILIASTAAASIFGSGIAIAGVGDMAMQLEPLFGSFSKFMLGIGLFAAGLTSSITAPLATAYAMTEILGIKGGSSSKAFKFIVLSVILAGTILALTGIKPISIILAAQFANGLLLPIIAIFLLYVMNQKSILNTYINKWLGNTLGVLVIVITAGLGVRMVLKVTGLI